MSVQYSGVGGREPRLRADALAARISADVPLRGRRVTAIRTIPIDASSTPLFAPAAYQKGYALIERSAYADALTALRSAIVNSIVRAYPSFDPPQDRRAVRAHSQVRQRIGLRAHFW